MTLSEKIKCFYNIFIQSYSCSFACRISSNNKKWFISETTMPHDYLEELALIYKGESEKQIESYDPEQESSDYVYEFNSENLIQQDAFSNVFLGLTNQTLENFTIETEEEFPISSKIDFFIHEFSFVDEKIFIFSKQTSSNVTKKKLYSFGGEEFIKLEKKDIYILNEDISCIYSDKKYYISNMKNFHGIFKYWKKLEEIRRGVLDNLSNKGIISNFREYREIYEKFYNLKTVIKIKEYEADMDTFIKVNKAKLSDICNTNDLNLNFDQNTCQFTINSADGVTILNRILSNRSGYNLMDDFVTFPSFKTHKSLAKTK